MYHSFLNLEAEQNVKERREMAGVEHPREQSGYKRLRLSDILRSWLVALFSRFKGRASKRGSPVQEGSKNAQIPGL
ncbi:MAG: hypothetical protein PVJ21_17390 [Anaerolineales bacterium]|jgi:hypothetical protein